MNGDRDSGIVLRMIEHCRKIEELIERFGSSLDVFSRDSAYQDAVNMNLFQIGELSNQLSDSFRDSKPEIPWRKMYGIRNIIAHAYVIVDMATVWFTIVKDIPSLASQLTDCLDELGGK